MAYAAAACQQRGVNPWGGGVAKKESEIRWVECFHDNAVLTLHQNHGGLCYSLFNTAPTCTHNSRRNYEWPEQDVYDFCRYEWV